MYIRILFFGPKHIGTCVSPLYPGFTASATEFVKSLVTIWPHLICDNDRGDSTIMWQNQKYERLIVEIDNSFTVLQPENGIFEPEIHPNFPEMGKFRHLFGIQIPIKCLLRRMKSSSDKEF